MARGGKGLLWARVAMGVAAAAGTAGTGAQQAGQWDNAPTGLLWACIVVPGAVAVVEQARLAIGERRSFKDGERREAIDRALTDALLEISEITAYSYRDLGLTAWSVKSTIAGRVLHREYRRRLTDRPQASKITWTKGKGIIGLCWAHEKEQHKDLREACTKYPDGVTGGRWAQVSPHLKQGMNLSEFNKMIGKYDEVLAVPITGRDGTFLGCVAVDVLARANGAEALSRLDSRDVKDIAYTTASVLARILQ